MPEQGIYEIIVKVNSEPETCFEFWLLSGSGILPAPVRTADEEVTL